MDMFPIPDADIMEQSHNSATVRLASNDAESATTTFDTIPDDVTLDQLVERKTQFLMQEYLNLVDWKGLELSSTERRCKASVKNSNAPQWRGQSGLN